MVALWENTGEARYAHEARNSRKLARRRKGEAIDVYKGWSCSLWLQVLLVIRGLKKECDYGYPIGKQHSGVLLYFENINW